MFVYCGNSCHAGERLWSLHGCLQALGDMPLGSLEHDGGVGIPAQNFGFLWAGERQVLGIDSFRYSQETACNQSHPLSCNSLFSGQRSTLGNGLSGGPCQSFVNS